MEATRMVSSPVSGKVFAAELSDPLPRSEPPPPLPGLSAVMAAACDYNEKLQKWQNLFNFSPL